jgi:hypothetical protein
MITKNIIFLATLGLGSAIVAGAASFLLAPSRKIDVAPGLKMLPHIGTRQVKSFQWDKN